MLDCVASEQSYSISETGDGYLSIDVCVGASVGLHARPAAQFVKTAKSYPCEILVGRPGAEPVDAKSILKVLALGAGNGERLVVIARGEQAEAALRQLGERVARVEDD